ncbi:metal-dependent hydrolase [Candidatus Micrarchaeota archaeon]|nr:metal-dependent hydrolase [Candidatus Micrarchaeota archaeon]
MNFLAHVLVSIIACELVALALGLGLLNPIVFAIALLGGLAPDLDHDKSKIYRYASVGVFFILFWFVFNYFQSINFVLTFNESVFSGLGLHLLAGFFVSSLLVFSIRFVKPRHRGMTHSVVFALLFALIVGFLTSSISFGLVGFVAYSSHLVADGVLKLF